MLTWSCPLLMTADLNKKRDAALCMVTSVFTSSLADAAFEYFIWLTEPQPFPIYFLSAFGKNVKMPKKANSGWVWPPLKQALYHSWSILPKAAVGTSQPGWGEHHTT